MFEAFYRSYWQSPLLMWVPAVLFQAWILRQRAPTFLGRYWAGFDAETVIDPFATGPLMKLSGLANSVVDKLTMTVFVLLGDLRVFWLIERFRPRGGAEGEGASGGFWGRQMVGAPVAGRRAFLPALGLTLIVPAVTLVALVLSARIRGNMRLMFLGYESMMLVLLLVYRTRIRRGSDTEDWLREILAFAAGYYALWASSDVIILSGIDAGYLLRVVPNLMYYGLTLPFMAWRAPAEIHGRGAQLATEEP